MDCYGHSYRKAFNYLRHAVSESGQFGGPLSLHLERRQQSTSRMADNASMQNIPSQNLNSTIRVFAFRERSDHARIILRMLSALNRVEHGLDKSPSLRVGARKCVVFRDVATANKSISSFGSLKDRVLIGVAILHVQEV